MGQRLVISIRHLDQDIARIYYHWSAYTVSALEETQKIWNFICEKDDPSVRDLQLRLIRMAEKDGGGIEGGETSAEFARIQSMFPDETFKTENISRNEGLIALSKEGMDGLLSWAEGTVVIDIDEGTVENNVFFDYYDPEEYREDHELQDFSLEDIPDIGVDLGYFSLDKLDDVIEVLNDLNDYAVRCGKNIYEKIM